MNEKRILVVDDEQPLRDFVSRNLSARGFDVKTASNGLEALAVFKTSSLDLIIMDIMMPSMDGLETCRRIRQNSVIPIIVLTALGEESDRVNALNAGADDCLTKPFGVEELLARVGACLRRVSWMQAQSERATLRHGQLELDPESVTVTVRNTQISLTQTEYKLLHYFMQNIGKTLPHDLILRQVWGHGYGEEAEYLRVYIGRIRKKIETDVSRPEYLRTEYGVGYRFG